MNGKVWLGVAALALVLATAAITGAVAHGRHGSGYGYGYGMGPGMMGPGMMMGPGIEDGEHGEPGYGPGHGMMMGPGYGMGPGMMGMMGPGMMMGRGMDPEQWEHWRHHMAMHGQSMGWAAHPGMMGLGPAWIYGMPELRAEPRALSLEEVRALLERNLAWHGNPRLKLGAVAESEDGTVTAEIVTQDGSLVQKLAVDRRSGLLRQAD